MQQEEGNNKDQSRNKKIENVKAREKQNQELALWKDKQTKQTSSQTKQDKREKTQINKIINER